MLSLTTMRTDIRHRLEAAAEPDVRASLKRLVPNAKILGVKVPEIRSLANAWSKEHPLDFETSVSPLTALCGDDLREEILFGAFLLARQKKQLRQIRWSDINEWLDHIDNWETCDQLASNVVATSVAENPALRRPLRVLTQAESVWRRRFAVSTAASLNHRGRFLPELTLDICQDLMRDENASIRKAVGWAIRELSKKDEEIAFAFLLAHRDDLATAMIRESSEKLSDERRKQLLA
jgi:3-methyladenine DNA glycosylase AlkD